MVTKDTKKTIGDWINCFAEGKKQQYIFSLDDLKSIEKGSIAIVMGKFVSHDILLGLLSEAWEIIPDQLFIIFPDDTSIKEARKDLLWLCGETQLYVASDGLIGAPALRKGFTISLTLPVKNEAETIGEVIESFLPVADQIVIGIDSSTTDNSKEICLRYTDEVFEFKWERSFAAARNICMEKCTSDWIFMTEGHESLLSKSYPYINQLNDIPGEVALVNVRRWIDGKHSIFPWLSRNLPGIHYINKSHNAIISEHKDCYQQTNLPQIETFHERSEAKDTERRKQRRTMNRINFYEKLLKDPHDSRTVFYLANEQFDFGEYTKAVGLYRRYLSLSSYCDERYQAKLHLGKCYVCLGDTKSAIDAFLSCALEPVPRNDHMMYLAELYKETSIDRSIYYLKMAATVDEPCSPMMIDPAFYHEAPLQSLCMIYSDLGRLDDALYCAKQIKERYPNTPSVDKIIEQIDTAKSTPGYVWDSYHDVGLEISKLSEPISV